MERIKITAVSVAADADGLATASICTGAGPWVPDVATEIGDDLAHLITITQVSATDHSAKTATITGTDANGAAQTETINLPSGASAVTSTKHFASVTSVAISATIGADTMTMGWAAESVSPWKNPRSGADMGIGCKVVSGSPSYSVQYTMDGSGVFDAGISGVGISNAGVIAFPVMAVRLKFTAAGGVNFSGLQY